MSFRSSIRTVEVQGIVQTSGGAGSGSATGGVTFRTASKETQSRDSLTNSASFAIPPSAKAGDLVIATIEAIHGSAGGISMGVSSGWTVLDSGSYATSGTGSAYLVASKVIGSSEPPLTVSFSPGVAAITSILTPTDALSAQMVASTAFSSANGTPTVTGWGGTMNTNGCALYFVTQPSGLGSDSATSWAVFGWQTKPTGAADWADLDNFGSPNPYSGRQKLATCAVTWPSGAYSAKVTCTGGSGSSDVVATTLLWLRK